MHEQVRTRYSKRPSAHPSDITAPDVGLDGHYNKMTDDTVFAAIIPTSADAVRAVKLPANRQHAVLPRHLPSRLRSDGTKDPVIAFDLSKMSGQRCLTFGASRVSDVRLPGADVAEQHFALYLDGSSRRFMIRDTSTRGIRLLSSAMDVVGKVKVAIPVSGSITVKLGDADRLRFRLEARTEDIEEGGALESHTNRWLRSLRSGEASRKRSYEGDDTASEPPRKRRKLNSDRGMATRKRKREEDTFVVASLEEPSSKRRRLNIAGNPRKGKPDFDDGGGRDGPPSERTTTNVTKGKGRRGWFRRMTRRFWRVVRFWR